MTAFNDWVIDASDLQATLSATADPAINNVGSAVTVLDVRPAEDFAAGHIPGAHPLDPSLLNRAEPPVGGLLPTAESVANWTNALGLALDSNVVVYDGGKATAAARAVWVLNAYGFTNISWLNGGYPVWTSNNYPTTTHATEAVASTTANTLTLNSAIVLTNDELEQSYTNPTPNTPKRQAIDARSSGEYEGSDVRSARGGRLPNAVHFEWLDMFQEDGRLKPDDDLLQALNQRAVNKDAPSVVYCQTHQRSAVTYVVMKHLGFKDVAALDGAWSSWGNDPNTPIET